MPASRPVLSRHPTRVLRALVWSIAIAGCTSTAAAPPPVEAFGSVPPMSDMSISPDGFKLAWANNAAAEPHVVLVDLQAGKTRRVGAAEDRLKLRGVQWADDETVLVSVSQTESVKFNKEIRFEKSRIMAVDVSGGPARLMLMQGTEHEFVSGASILALRTPIGKRIVMSTLDWNGLAGYVTSTFDVDTTTGRGRVLDRGSEYTYDWIADPQGTVVARAESGPGENEHRLQARDGKRWRTVHESDDEDPPALIGLSRDGKSVVALGLFGEPRNAAWLLPLDGSPRQRLAGSDTEDVESVQVDPVTRAPVGVSYGGTRQRSEWFDEDARRRVASLEKAFAGRRAHLLGASRNGMRLLVLAESPSHAPTWYLVDRERRSAEIIGETYPMLSGVTLGEVRVFEYTSRDGVPLIAYLTLPPGAGERGLKLVVLPHGGPESRDDFAFDWLAQFIASRGIAVVQPQYRGSTGFGEEHRKAGYGQWGRRMQDDLSDAVKALVEQGIADPAHVGIAGASYGGYAALAGAAFTPDLYSCAVSINGISDLPLAIGQLRIQRGDDSGAVAYWEEHIGSQHDEAVISASPARSAGTVRAPVLLLHGRDDVVVPPVQSREMARKLRAAGKTVTLVELDGEDHWLSRSETRIRVLRELDGFLATHL